MASTDDISFGMPASMETEQVPVQIHGEATPQAKRKRTSWQHMLGATERPRDCSSSPASDSSPVSLEPRTRPAAGVMAVHGPYAPHTRLCARGLFNWRNYGKLPTATVVMKDGCLTKEFVWSGLFKDVKGRKVFIESGTG